MAIRLEKAVIRGELSNEIRGQVTGRLWLHGRKDPVILNLRGNCLRDLAGCVLTFENPQPSAIPHLDLLASLQEGVVGDMTASRKSRLPTVSDERLLELMERREPIPTRLANILCLEWFSETNGRVVIEAADFRLQVSESFWHMSRDEDAAQVLDNQRSFHRYIDAITGMDGDDDEDEFADDEDEEPDDDAFGNSFDAPTPDAAGEAFAAAMEADGTSAAEDDDGPLDEFEWEQELREGDRRAEAYFEACDRYRDHPERERLIAEAMGVEMDEMEEMKNQLTGMAEGFEIADPAVLDQVREVAEDEAAHHPLSRRAMNFALRLQRDAEAHGLLAQDSGRESPVVSVIIGVIALGGKLAAALDPMVGGYEMDSGFVIAMLKRAQVPLNEALHALSSIETRHLKRGTRAWITQARDELFALRGEILDLMNRLRAGG